ncbi:MAG: potassium transporter TrkG [Candidatus Eisenbacteria bacterium]
MAVGVMACFIFWAITHLTCAENEGASWTSGLVTASLSWLLAMVFSAIPLYLSGHFGSFLDACFDAMSGLATTGLSLIQDLDHLAYGTNLWRHLMMFLGGQGIVVLLLAFFASGSWAFMMYVGEARDEKILPNVSNTARFIWAVATVYLVLGTTIIWFSMLKGGMPAARGFFHSICLFMAGYDTGGFTPMSQSVLYYHSIWVECATVFIMILGMINFAVHFRVWTGNRRELYRNVEMKTLAVTIALTTLVAALSLGAARVYPDAVALFRKGFYQIISGHSGTGFMTIYGREFALQWTPLALFAAIIAMGLGGAACSTAGGIKALRVNISARSIWAEVKRLMSPPSSVLDMNVHHIRKVRVTDRLVRGVMVVTACYLLTYLGGALIVSMYGHPISLALFESTSACANVGLTCGITAPSMPALMKVVFVLQMWAGRLEFMSVFLLIGTAVALARGK